MENKTLTEVYSKASNRFAKIIYIFLLIVTLFFIYLFTIGLNSNYRIDWKNLITSLIITFIIFEGIKRAFYYITTKTIIPKK